MALKKGTKNHYVDVLPLNRYLFIYLFIYFYLMFLQATFKLETYCVTLALPRQSSFSALNPIKVKSTAPLFSLSLRFTTQ